MNGVHTTNWDCVAFDEYHYGVEKTPRAPEAESKKRTKFGGRTVLTDIMPVH
jgi:hypothetical protein